MRDKILLPLLEDDTKDERFDGVVLLFESEDEKKTAEDCGLYWYFRDWEKIEIEGTKYWFSRSSNAINKSFIKKLARIKG